MHDDDAMSVFRDTLDLIAEGVTATTGFETACISVVRAVGDELDDHLQVLAVAGSDEARAQLLDHRTSVADLEAEIANGDDWGLLRFVPAERIDLAAESYGWVPDLEPSDDPDDWHPLDLLLAPFRDTSGRLRGMMSIDLPSDGRRPGPEQRELLQKYAAHAGRAVLTAAQREEAARAAAMAETVRDVVRRASAELSLSGILTACERVLVDGFAAEGLWLQTYAGTPGRGSVSRIHAADGREVHLPRALVAVGESAAEHCWLEQSTVVVAPWRPRPPMLDPGQHRQVLEFLASIEVDAILFAPLGSGPTCLGNLVLTRARGEAGDWLPVECAAVLEVGADLGRAVLTARDLEREQAAIAELRALDGYRTRLVSTLVEELTEPIGRIAHDLGTLRHLPDLPPTMSTLLGPMERGTVRMSRVVEDLGLLSRVGDPAHPLRRVPVDLRRLVEGAVELVAAAADQQGVVVEMREPSSSPIVGGDADELDRVVVNLVSNAVKYTPAGGRVTVALTAYDGQVVLEVSDTGLGIADQDHDRLFAEFFRSSNPEALRRPGTGLGLAIVARVVDRHDGRIEVESVLGEGSTFRVHLPTTCGRR